MLTPLQTLNSFASRLSCIESSGVERDELHEQVSSLATSKRSSGRYTLNPSFEDLRLCRWMSQSVSFENDVVGRVPQALLKSVTSSFVAVLRQKRQLYIRNSIHFLATSKAANCSRPSPLRLATLEMLAKDTVFQVSTVISRFRTMPLSKGRITEATGIGIGQAELPLTFFVEIQVTVLNQQMVKATLYTSGKIKGWFRPGSNFNHMERIELELDTAALYKSVAERACSLVKIADKIATEHASKCANEKINGQARFAQTLSKSSSSSAALLPHLGSTENGRLQKGTEPVARCA
jgi:hypothetical protein